MNAPVTVDLWILEEPAVLAASLTASLESMLDDREKARYRRFARTEDKQRFLLNRSFVRQVLAGYRDTSPVSLQICTSTFGKPLLVQGEQEELIHFNLSHTRGWAALAVCRQAEVGVDIELLDRNPDMEGLARRYFSVQEVTDLMELEAADRCRRFFALWTAKEAFLKAIGLGLRIPLNSFSVFFSGQHPAIFRHGAETGNQFVCCRHWFMAERCSLALVACVDPVQEIIVNFNEWSPDDNPLVSQLM